jgi:hypothetical protein
MLDAPDGESQYNSVRLEQLRNKLQRGVKKASVQGNAKLSELFMTRLEKRIEEFSAMKNKAEPYSSKKIEEIEKEVTVIMRLASQVRTLLNCKQYRRTDSRIEKGYQETSAAILKLLRSEDLEEGLASEIYPLVMPDLYYVIPGTSPTN